MRLKSLDFLRGIAVILVLFRHSNVVEILTQIGWIGVDLFFVLSGFLVSGLLFKEYITYGSINAKLFFIRRGLKIYPLFYFAILLTVVFNLVLLHEGFSKYSFQVSSLLSELFFVQSYFGGLWPHTWSLAVEEHFYIMLIIIFYLLARSKTLSHAVVFNFGFLVIALFCLLCRCYTVLYTDNSVWQSLFQTHLRIDSLFFGVWLSYHFHFNKEKFVLVFQRYRSLIAITSMLLLLPVFFIELDSGFILTLQLSLLYLSFGGILGVFLTASFKNAKKIIPSPLINIIVTIGFYSYSIYLFHLFGNKYLIPVFVKSVTFEVSKYVLSIIYFLSAIAMGILFSKLIELPVLAFRDKHFSRTKVINSNVK